MALLTAQTSLRAANDLTFVSATATTGDTFSNTGKEMILVNNGSGGSINVTITTPATVDGLAVADKVIAVGNTKVACLGPFPKGIYDDNDDLVTFVCSSVSSVTVAVIRTGTL